MVRAVARLDEFLEDVVEALILEISLLFRDPFLQPEVRFNDEFLLDHVSSYISSLRFRLGFSSRRGSLCHGVRPPAARRSFSRARPSTAARRRHRALP